jgi:hypothetical protein
LPLIVVAGGTRYFLGANRTAPTVARACFNRGAALHKPLERSEPGLFRRWYHREPHHRTVAHAEYFVIARNTAFTFKGKDIDAKEIGEALGLRYVLEGSVQRDQNRVRVS